MTLSETPRNRMASPKRVFVLAFLLTFLSMAIWSLATPLFASPDESTQVVRAAALVRGELIGTTIKNARNPVTEVTVPELYSAGQQYETCFVLKDTVPASCAAPLSGSSKAVATITYVGRYPPLYYAIVGLPSLLTVSPTGVYLMRLMSCLLNAAFLALAVMSIVTWSESRLLLIGFLLAATPMTFFLGGVVNPSGLEITSAICLWCSGLVLALERAQKPPPGLVVVVVTAATVLLLTRGLSPLWVVLIVVLLAMLTGRRGIVGIARARIARWSLVLLLPSAAFALVWIVAAHALDLLPVGVPIPRGETHTHLAASIFGDTGSWIQQMIGVFGSLDTLSPLITYIVWYAGIGLVVLLALACAKLRQAAPLVLTVVIVLIAPVVISYAQAYRLGVIWQARYIMPMAVGIPLLAVALLERSDTLRLPKERLATILSVAIGLAQFAAFTEALRRYMVGVTGPIDYLHGAWRPPLGALALTIGYLVTMILLLAFMRHLVVLGPPHVDECSRLDQSSDTNYQDPVTSLY